MVQILCSGCKKTKPRDAFTASAIYKNGTSGRCRLCAVKSSLEYARRNPEKMKEKNALKFKRWREKNPKLWQPLLTKEGRLCRTCGERKGKEQFNADVRSRDGLSWKCRSCASLAHAKWRAENPEHHRAMARRVARKQRQTNPDRVARNYRAHVLKKRYGITLSEAAGMLEAQEGRCMICASAIAFGPPKNGERPAQIDHCHSSKKVRGILCFGCNVGLGAFRDNPHFIRAAIKYLADHS